MQQYTNKLCHATTLMFVPTGLQCLLPGLSSIRHQVMTTACLSLEAGHAKALSFSHQYHECCGHEKTVLLL